MSTDPDDFDQLIASLGAMLALTDDGQSIGDGLAIPDAIDVGAVRKKTGLTQAAFARRIGVQVSTIRNWEGRPGSCWHCSTEIRGSSKKRCEPEAIAGRKRPILWENSQKLATNANMPSLGTISLRL
jgi:hypothetical protein